MAAFRPESDPQRRPAAAYTIVVVGGGNIIEARTVIPSD
jgi:hypothetical protein